MPGTNLTREEAAARAAALEVSSYHVDLDLTGGESVFRSVTTVHFSCAQPGAGTFIDLIAAEVHRVELNGRPLDVEQVRGPARIQLPELTGTNELVVEADCAYMHTGEGLHRFVDPVDDQVYLYTQFEVADARRVFACFDQPDLKASFVWTVTAPQDWQVVSVSPTPTPERLDDGAARWRFAPTARLAPYVTALVAGPYHCQRGELTSRDGRVVPLGVFCRASLADHLDAEEVMDLARAGFTYFEELFDHAYPFEKYDQLFVPEFNAGAMENAGAVTITETYVFRSKVPQALVERRGLTILHELAHMWFGDLVTMRWWDDLWLNESFAEYASTRCQSEATRWATSWTTFLSAEKAWAYRQDQLGSTHPIVADIRDLADVEVNFDGITYAKGASVLKQLVHWVGRDAFDAGLRAYIAKHAWGNTTLADLLDELAATSGRDLNAWAASWLRTAGVNTLRPVVEVDADNRVTSAQIVQTAPTEHPDLRPHRLAVGCYDLVSGILTRTNRFELDVAGEATELGGLVGRARPDLLLVNDDDLAYGKIRLDARSLDTAIGHLSDFAESLPRTLVWGAAWDMTRDAEMRGRDFVQLVLGNIASVDDPSVAQTLLRQLASALQFYIAPTVREETTVQAADALLELLRRAAPGSDLQLLLARSFASHATSPAQLDVVAGLLAGEQELPGLVVDTERRWDLLGALVAGGRAGDADIEAELARDDTASGRVHAAGVRAMTPTAEAKAEVWEQVVDKEGLPNASQAAMIGGFSRVRDARLLEPFVQPYFDGLERVWSERTSEMASQVVVGLYPTMVGSQAVVDATTAWLQDHPDAEPALVRLLVEGRDGVQRALRGQERDAAGDPTSDL